MTKLKFNHSPFIFNVWVPFNGWRFKDPYYIRLQDGRELLAFPNGASWSDKFDNRYEDEEVTHIKLAEDGSMRRAFTGGWRVARNLDYFGVEYPIYCDGEFIDPNELAEDKKIIPIIVFGHRKKYADDKLYLLVTTGEVVDINDPRPGIDSLSQYTQDTKYFWCGEDTEILSPFEVMSAIKRYNRYPVLVNDKVFYEKASNLLTKFNTPDNQWVASMVMLPALGDIDSVVSKYGSPKGINDRLFHINKPVNTSGRLTMLNDSRGGIPVDKVSDYTVPVYTLVKELPPLV